VAPAPTGAPAVAAAIKVPTAAGMGRPAVAAAIRVGTATGAGVPAAAADAPLAPPAPGTGNIGKPDVA
jgi:hypothetical protein